MLREMILILAAVKVCSIRTGIYPVMEIALHPFMPSSMKVLISEMLTALQRLHNTLQDGWSPE